MGPIYTQSDIFQLKCLCSAQEQSHENQGRHEGEEIMILHITLTFHNKNGIDFHYINILFLLFTTAKEGGR